MKQSGNALFLILIAVALFAALSYAVTQSGRGGGSIDREQDTIAAAQVMQYMSVLQSAVQKMQLLNGTTDTEFSFDASEWGFNNYQHGTPQPSENQVFNADGGGVAFQDFNVLGRNKFVGTTSVNGLGDCTDNSSSACKELMFIIDGVTESLCQELNRNILGDPTIHSSRIRIGDLSMTAQAFNGTYDTDTGAQTYVNTAGLIGQPTACMNDTDSPGNPTPYVFYFTLIAR